MASGRPFVTQTLLTFCLSALAYLWRLRRNARVTLFERGVELDERGVLQRIEFSSIRVVETDASKLWLTLASGEKTYVAWGGAARRSARRFVSVFLGFPSSRSLALPVTPPAAAQPAIY